jgi:hypothetical protein
MLLGRVILCLCGCFLGWCVFVAVAGGVAEVVVVVPFVL